MRILKPVLFILAIVLAVEVSFRVHLYGSAALHPAKMNSFTQLHDSGLVRTAENKDIFYELRPDIDVWYKGMRFTTNSVGLRDREYSLQKPDNVFRIVVLGSSWTMGSGVEDNEIWHARLEDWLNAESGGKQIELINFAVDQYGLGEILATLEQKALPYDPDLVLVAITNYTPVVAWSDTRDPYVEMERRNPFFDLHSLRVLDKRMNWGLMKSGHSGREHWENAIPPRSMIQSFADGLEAVGVEHDLPIVLVKLAYQARWKRESVGPPPVLPGNPAFLHIDVTEYVTGSGYKPVQLNISTWDSHPNAIAHELIAEAILEQMLAQNLLPEETAEKFN